MLPAPTASTLEVRRRPLTTMLASLAIAFIAAIQSISAGAQDFYSPPTELIDKVVGFGSPTLVYFDGSVTAFYVNHGNAPNQIYEDKGLTNNTINTSITPYTGGLIDVGAAVLANGNPIISYVNSSGNVSFAYSSNFGQTFTSVVPSSTSLGLPSGVSPNPILVPALTNLNGVVYIATVSSANHIYISTTTNGTSFTPYTAGVAATTYTTISRPSLTVHSNGIWLGFISNVSGVRAAIVGNVSIPSSFTPVGNGASTYGWSNSNTAGYYAGISLSDVGGTLYLVGQYAGSQQYLEGTSNSNPPTSAWSAQTILGSPALQEHWTPSLLTVEDSDLFVIFQDDSNNNISYTSATL
jgi:hypothetical protein